MLSHIQVTIRDKEATNELLSNVRNTSVERSSSDNNNSSEKEVSRKKQKTDRTNKFGVEKTRFPTLRNQGCLLASDMRVLQQIERDEAGPILVLKGGAVALHCGCSVLLCCR